MIVASIDPGFAGGMAKVAVEDGTAAPQLLDAIDIRSQAKYHEMKKEGWGPVEMEVGRRRLISYEAASVWRRERKTTASSTAGE
jgi:hypothetical protein